MCWVTLLNSACVKPALSFHHDIYPPMLIKAIFHMLWSCSKIKPECPTHPTHLLLWNRQTLDNLTRHCNAKSLLERVAELLVC
uniref:Uncharacterized protein n=1 Tax=Pyxicephalus adspersus TaxID=30357 RepID=A0AAV2ZT26_PYXAD|nr:TPA: hypothetical protein GDO54_003013 [Pyxicephalus adspersus]